ncbi:MAG: aminotransferase class IV [Coriobacteriia bacterium]|nr:aminotransferase class IV [Coriobacteriia bacterium]
MTTPVRAPGAPRQALRETCRAVAGRIPLWPYHRARLVAGGCTGAVLEQVEEAALAAAAEWEGPRSPRVRLSLTVSSDGAVAVDARRRLSSLDVPGGPIAVRVDVVDQPPLPAGAAKPADRSWWDEAQRRAVFEGGHQAIIVSPDGLIIDGGSATVWVVEGATIVTPPSPPAVAGVARAFLMQAAPDTHLHIKVEPLSWERFLAADEAFLTNAFGAAVGIRDRGGFFLRAVESIFDEMWRHSI